MAKAQVTISAVDKTQAAINSALRGMKSVERASKVTAKAVNLAFGFLTGGIIVSAFRKVTEAAKKTEEGQKALLEMNKALRDPALVAAAENLTNILVTGFTEAIKRGATFIKFMRGEMISLGIIGPGETAQDAASIIKGQISNKAMLAGQMGMAGQLANVEILNKEIDALREQLKIVESLADEEAKRDAARIDAAIKFENAVKNMTDVTISSVKKSLSAMDALLQGYEETTRTPIQQTLASFAAKEAMIESLLQAGKITADEAEKRMMYLLETVLPEVEVTGKERVVPAFKEAVDQITVFAEQAAKNMQSAFANFLFDPFQDGLRGMLKGFIDTIRRMVAEFAASEILKFFFSPFTGSSGFLGSFAKYVTGEKAMGGSVMGGRPYLVGERGPELFVPGSNGSIVPNNRMGGTTIAPVYNIDARGATADLQQALPGILQENNRRIFDELDRRYGIGR